MTQHKRTVLLISTLCLAIIGSVWFVWWRGSAYAQEAAPADLALTDEVVSSGFSYRGRLFKNGTAITGVECEIEFSLWNAVTGGNQIGSTQKNSGVKFSNGYFTVNLNDTQQFGTDAFDGGPRYLRTLIKCPGDSDFKALDNRVIIQPIPYALGLRPGAVMKGEGTGYTLEATADDGVALRAESTNGDAISAVAVRGGSGINASGFFFGHAGYFENATTMTPTVKIVNANAVGGGQALDVTGQTVVSASLNQPLLVAQNSRSSDKAAAILAEGMGIGVEGAAIRGVATNTISTTYGVYGTTRSEDYLSAGVFGEATGGEHTTMGVYGKNSSNTTNVFGVAGVVEGNGYTVGTTGDNRSNRGIGVLGTSRGQGPTEEEGAIIVKGAAVVGAAQHDFLFLGTSAEPQEGVSIVLAPIQYGVDAKGNVYARGKRYSIKSDFAELVTPGSPELVAGDVLAVNEEGQFVCTQAAFQDNVVGVYSTDPGFVGGFDLPKEYDPADPEGQPFPQTDKVPLAVVGIVPVKVTDENDFIKPGDLLVSSSTPCRAMRDLGDRPVGTVIGKALEPLESEQGTILMLVSLQ